MFAEPQKQFLQFDHGNKNLGNSLRMDFIFL